MSPSRRPPALPAARASFPSRSERLRRAVDRRREAEEALRSSEERYRELLENLPVGVYRTTSRGRFVEANPALARMLGARREASLFRRNVKDFYVRRTDRSTHLRRLRSSPLQPAEFQLRRPDGRTFWVRDHPRAVQGPEGRVLWYDGILVDVTERRTAEARLRRALETVRRTNEKLRELNQTDDLTGLGNRRGFFTLGHQALRIAGRARGGACVLFLDLDGLKAINDTHGHAAGDRALRAVGEIFRRTLRSSDVVGRIGGDEFAVLSTRAGRRGAEELARRIRAAVRRFNALRALPFPISLSAGVVPVPARSGASLEDVLARADREMYGAKRKRKG